MNPNTHSSPRNKTIILTQLPKEKLNPRMCCYCPGDGFQSQNSKTPPNVIYTLTVFLYIFCVM